ncbi:MAG: hypothetical protein AAF525_07150 [Pseudomonadota bacterium]
MSENNDYTNALLDRWLAGELDEQGQQQLQRMAASDPVLADLVKITAGTRDSLDRLTTSAPPQTLERRLLSVPDRHTRRAWWRSVAAAAVVAVCVAGGGAWIAFDRHQQQLAEVAKAREDMAVAMYYLQKTTQRMRSGVRRQVRDRLTEVPRKTLRTMGSELGVLPLGNAQTNIERRSDA